MRKPLTRQQRRTPAVAIAESAPQQNADGKTDKVDGEGLRAPAARSRKLGADIGQRRAINRFRYLRKHQCAVTSTSAARPNISTS
jgi:hypothetical protein